MGARRYHRYTVAVRSTHTGVLTTVGVVATDHRRALTRALARLYGTDATASLPASLPRLGREVVARVVTPRAVAVVILVARKLRVS